VAPKKAFATAAGTGTFDGSPPVEAGRPLDDPDATGAS
jgi:hypothetical protein